MFREDLGNIQKGNTGDAKFNQVGSAAYEEETVSGVVQKAEHGCLLVRSSTSEAVKLATGAFNKNQVVGIFLYNPAFPTRDLYTGEGRLKDGVIINYVYRGQIYVPVYEGVSIDDPVYFEHTDSASSASGNLYQFGKTSLVSGDERTSAVPAKFMQSAKAGETAKIFIDTIASYAA